MLTDLLQKAPEDLVMNQADSYRGTQEERYLIDRTIPFVDYGKGCELQHRSVCMCVCACVCILHTVMLEPLLMCTLCVGFY